MLAKNKQEEILVRYADNQSIRRIAQEMELSRNTVRQTVRSGAARGYARASQKETKLAPYADWAQQRFHEVEGNATLLYQELKERGYTGGYGMLKVFVHPLREDLHKKATVRFETPPGQQAQVDFGSKTILVGGKPQRVHIFVMTLGYSRAMYAELVFNEKLETLIACHENAFRWIGGVPEEILYDNPKTIVLDRGGAEARMNPKFEDFSRYYGYTARLCRPYRAQTKGKVEAGVKYIKRSFLPGKAFENLTEGNATLWGWIRGVADERIHGTTFEKPSVRFKDENLVPLGNRPPYINKAPAMRKVAMDGMVNIDTNRYSVPWQYIGQQLETRRQGDTLYVYKDGQLVAQHPWEVKKHQTTVDPAHYQGIQQRRTTTGRNAPHAVPAAPEVQVRPLAEYAQLAAGGGFGG